MDFQEIKLPHHGVTRYSTSNLLLKQRENEKTILVINVCRNVHLSHVPGDVLLKNHSIRSLEDVEKCILSFLTIFMVYPTLSTCY